MYDFSVDLLLKEFYGRIDLSEKDIFLRLQKALLIKIELIHKFPEMFDFIKVVYFENSTEIKSDLEQRTKELKATNFGKILEDIDLLKFKNDLDINKTLNIILWTIDGLSNKAQEKMRLSPIDKVDYKEIVEEVNVYFDILKNVFYK